MKKSDIVVGGVYSNGKAGRFYQERTVVDIDNTGKYKTYSGQMDSLTLKYHIVKKGTKECAVWGIMTVTRFASWAKKKV